MLRFARNGGTHRAAVIAPAIALILAACGGQGGGEPPATGERIACAAAGERDFRDDCGLTRARDAGGALILTVSQPSGGFRRLRVVDDGRGVEAADGAETAQVTLIDGGGIEVAIAGDRYRLPATIRQP